MVGHTCPPSNSSVFNMFNFCKMNCCGKQKRVTGNGWRHELCAIKFYSFFLQNLCVWRIYKRSGVRTKNDLLRSFWKMIALALALGRAVEELKKRLFETVGKTCSRGQTFKTNIYLINVDERWRQKITIKRETSIWALQGRKSSGKYFQKQKVHHHQDRNKCVDKIII